MARYERGVLGSFNGSVGTVTGAKWKGIEYMKIKRGKSTKPPTERQIEHRAKFGLIIHFLASMGKLLMVTFRDSAIQMTGVNSAFKYLYDNAVTGVYPAYAIDFSKVLISQGQLLNAGNPAAGASGNGGVKITWTDNSGTAMANPDDKLVVAVHCPELKRTIYTLKGAPRSDGSFNLDVSPFTGKVVETWVAFISADAREVATSVYTGQVTVS